MSYGLTLDQVRTVNRPAVKHASWGSVVTCTEMAEYSLYGLQLLQGGAQPLHFYRGGARTLFVEAGDVIVRTLDENGSPSAHVVSAGAAYDIPEFAVHALASRGGAEAYVFGPPGSRSEPVMVETASAAEREFAALASKNLPASGRPTSDVREKYWGRIETILGGEVAGKRILVEKGGQSSLEFHVFKRETYWIRSGLLKLGLRVGRGENYSILIRPGESYDVRPGVMHMRMALEDTVIIEVSTRDDDADSYLVEDGQTYVHVEKQAAAA